MKKQLTFDEYFELNSVDDALVRVFSMIGYDSGYVTRVVEWCKNCGRAFLLSDYHTLPLDNGLSEYTDEDYGNAISVRFARHMLRYTYLLSAIDIEVTNYTIKNFNGTRKKSFSNNTSNSGTDTHNETVARSGTKTNSGKDINTNNRYEVTEDAPITSTIDEINTPNYKGKSTNNNEFEHGKIVTDSYTDDTSGGTTYGRKTEENGSDENVDPYMFEVFLRVSKENNLYDKIIECYKSIIHEFNYSL